MMVKRRGGSIYFCLYRFSLFSTCFIMAYNREWDRGKDSWTPSNQLSTQDSKATIRGREEDYTGDGKRRKFNNGVRGIYSTIYYLSLLADRVTMVPETMRMLLRMGLPTTGK